MPTLPSPLFLAALACTCSLTVLAAQDADSSLGIHANAGLVSAYMAHGLEIHDGACFQPSVAVDAVLPGLQFKLWNSTTIDRDQYAHDEYDGMMLYGRRLGSGWNAIDLHGYVDYWVLPHANRPEGRQTGWKFNAGTGLPTLISVGKVMVGIGYDLYHWTPDQADSFEAGSVHEGTMSVACDLPPAYVDRGLRQVVVSGQADYHTGEFGVKRGLGNADLGLSLPIAWKSVSLTPTVWHQWSFIDSVAPQDRTWATINLGWNF